MSAFNKFKEAVLNSYREKFQANDLHDKLTNPTPANIRDYTLFFISNEISADDKKTIRDFFGSMDDYSDLERAISNFDIDKLKPLKNFIIGKTSNPDETIVKLWAVLIDFKPRPFRIDDWTTAAKPSTDQNIIGQSYLDSVDGHKQPLPTQTTNESDHIVLQENQTKKSNKKINVPGLLAIGSIAVLVGSLGYLGLKENKECMVWFKDRYICVNCMDNTIKKDQVIALDRDKLEHFRKITRIDTLSLDDVNKIWYSKVNNEVEFFTTSGIHPEHPERGLKLATAYIIQKYAIGEDSLNSSIKSELDSIE